MGGMVRKKSRPLVEKQKRKKGIVYLPPPPPKEKRRYKSLWDLLFS